MSLTITRRNLSPVGLLDKQTVSDTAVGLDFTPGAVSAEITVETQGIRYRDDGIDPTPTVGKRIDAGADPFFYEGDLSAFKMIRASGFDATVQTLFYNGGPAGTKWDVSEATVVHYKLNEAAPNTEILDASGNAFNGIIGGGKTTRDVSIAGLVSTGTAFDLDGGADFGNIDNALIGSGSTLPTSITGTWLCVIEPDDVNANQDRILHFGDTSAARYIAMIQDSANGKVRCLSLNGSIIWDFRTVDVVIANGTKTWLALVQDGVSPKLFVDGIEAEILFTTSTNLGLWFNDIPLLDNGRIGCLNFNGGGNTQFWNGTIDDVRIFDRVLTRLEIAAIHNNDLGTEAVRGVFP